MISQLVYHRDPSLLCVPKPGGLARLHWMCVFVWTLTTNVDYWNDLRELEPLEQRIKCWNLMMKYAAGQRALDAGETVCVCVCFGVHMWIWACWECVCVSRVYNSFITLSAAAYAKPQRKTQWFRVGSFCRETEQAYRETSSVKVHNSFVRDTSICMCPEYFYYSKT